MPSKCRRCGNYHMQGNCDEGYDRYSFKPYPKWRLVWRRIYKFGGILKWISACCFIN